VVAQEQKKMIKTLIKKGWSKNEIIYEVQRLYGNDVLILKQKLDDERGFVGKYGMPMMFIMAASSFVFAKRRRMLMAERAM
jgi:cytochrome c-type biogenesis protein CcmH/NrfF